MQSVWPSRPWHCERITTVDKTRKPQPQIGCVNTEDLRIRKYGRYWAVYDPDGTLVVVAVYKKGAEEVLKRLTAQSLTLPTRLIRKEGDDES